MLFRYAQEGGDLPFLNDTLSEYEQLRSGTLKKAYGFGSVTLLGRLQEFDPVFRYRVAVLRLDRELFRQFLPELDQLMLPLASKDVLKRLVPEADPYVLELVVLRRIVAKDSSEHDLREILRHFDEHTGCLWPLEKIDFPAAANSRPDALAHDLLGWTRQRSWESLGLTRRKLENVLEKASHTVGIATQPRGPGRRRGKSA